MKKRALPIALMLTSCTLIGLSLNTNVLRPVQHTAFVLGLVLGIAAVSVFRRR